MCGGSWRPYGYCTTGWGLSPRVRGKPVSGLGAQRGGGSIPACAGEAYPRGHQHNGRRVYPRVCGGSTPAQVMGKLPAGLSPRVRGKPPVTGQAQAEIRSIPACAGEAGAMAARGASGWVYPRVCGGSTPVDTGYLQRSGLSPRVRGKLGDVPPLFPNPRSIPACAGEARQSAQQTSKEAVYPRVCGGSWVCADLFQAVRGLSPRVRGKPGRVVQHQSGGGSIPACAGEAKLPKAADADRGVYPRVCGGSPAAIRPPPAYQGLSPRVRGKRRHIVAPGRIPRSIPACAGEAQEWSERRVNWTVYPRVCGGSVTGNAAAPGKAGLSPRVRGKPFSLPPHPPPRRSIPACAGEAPPTRRRG